MKKRKSGSAAAGHALRSPKVTSDLLEYALTQEETNEEVKWLDSPSINKISIKLENEELSRNTSLEAKSQLHPLKGFQKMVKRHKREKKISNAQRNEILKLKFLTSEPIESETISQFQSTLKKSPEGKPAASSSTPKTIFQFGNEEKFKNDKLSVHFDTHNPLFELPAYSTFIASTEKDISTRELNTTSAVASIAPNNCTITDDLGCSEMTFEDSFINHCHNSIDPTVMQTGPSQVFSLPSTIHPSQGHNHSILSNTSIPYNDSIFIMTKEEEELWDSIDSQIANSNNVQTSEINQPTNSTIQHDTIIQNVEIEDNQHNKSEGNRICLKMKVTHINSDTKRRIKYIRANYINEINPILIVSEEKTYSIVLSEDWFYTDFEIGNVIQVIDISSSHIIESNETNKPRTIFRDSRTIVINNDCGLFIVNPDGFLSPTKVAESCSCLRKSVISDHLKSFGNISGAAVMGNLRHCFIENLTDKVLNVLNSTFPRESRNQLYQHNLDSELSNMIQIIKKKINNKEIYSLIQSCKETLLSDLYVCGITDQMVLKDLLCITDPLISWTCKSYQFGIHSFEHSTNSMQIQNNSITTLERVAGIEETFICPEIGLKGQLDIVAKSTIHYVDLKTIGNNNSSSLTQEILLPIELKTGKWKQSTVITHRAQVLLYILMLMVRDRQQTIVTDKKNRNPCEGLILYLSENESKVDIIKPNWNEMIALIGMRNKLAQYHKTSISSSSSINSTLLPPVIQSLHDCQYCYQAAECVVHHSAIEGGNEESFGLTELYRYIAKGLTSHHMSYLKKWDSLLNLESTAAANKGKNAINQLNVTSVHNLELLSCNQLNESRGISNYYELILRSNDNYNSNNNNAYSIDVGDKVIVNVKYFIQNRSCQSVSMVSSTIEQNICSGYLKSNSNGYFYVVVHSKPRRLLEIFSRHAINSNHYEDSMVSYGAQNEFMISIQKDEISINISTLKTNLYSLFCIPFNGKDFADSKLDARETPSKPNDRSLHLKLLRELVIDLKPPFINDMTVHQVNQTSQFQNEILLLKPFYMNDNEYLSSIRQFQQYMHLNKSKVQSNSQSISKDLSDNNKEDGVVVDMNGVLHINGGLKVYPGCNPFDLLIKFNQCNENQQHAIRNIVSNSQYYSLIVGLPGSGKTSTLALATLILIAKGYKVLISSYTHSAVDNLLLKIINSGYERNLLIRFGSSNYVHLSLHDTLLESSSVENNSKRILTSISQFQHRNESARIFACTVLSVPTSHLLKFLQLDYCIVDEAGQITQPATLGPMLVTKRFILVGDEKQLPPLVLSQQALAAGMSISLFERLLVANPSCASVLTIQYRMNKEICELNNLLSYEGNGIENTTKMKCGSNDIAEQKIKLPNLHLLPFPRNESFDQKTNPVNPLNRSDWLYWTIDPMKCFVLLDCDEKYDQEVQRSIIPLGIDQTSHSSVINEAEAKVILSIMQGLAVVGYDLKQTGIITPFRAQAALINTVLEKNNLHHNVDCSTVDKFQGQDKECIILSLVKVSILGKEDSVGNLLKDWRRINVALTRAKCKIIIIGSVKIMNQVPILQRLATIAQQRDRVRSLSSHDLNSYEFDERLFVGHSISSSKIPSNNSFSNNINMVGNEVNMHNNKPILIPSNQNSSINNSFTIYDDNLRPHPNILSTLSNIPNKSAMTSFSQSIPRPILNNPSIGKSTFPNAKQSFGLGINQSQPTNNKQSQQLGYSQMGFQTQQSTTAHQVQLNGNKQYLVNKSQQSQSQRKPLGLVLNGNITNALNVSKGNNQHINQSNSRPNYNN
eukprot:gene9048-12201_t